MVDYFYKKTFIKFEEMKGRFVNDADETMECQWKAHDGQKPDAI